MCCAPCTSSIRRYGSPSLLICSCGSLWPSFSVPAASLSSSPRRGCCRSDAEQSEKDALLVSGSSRLYFAQTRALYLIFLAMAFGLECSQVVNQIPCIIGLNYISKRRHRGPIDSRHKDAI